VEGVGRRGMLELLPLLVLLLTLGGGEVLLVVL
jgi:hypothetical protein